MTTYYTMNGGQVLRQQTGDEIIDFTYDASGNPFSLTVNGTTYYYVCNALGDVMKIVDGSGMNPQLPTETIDFVADRPFLFAVAGRNDTLLFVGIVEDPTQS